MKYKKILLSFFAIMLFTLSPQATLAQTASIPVSVQPQNITTTGGKLSGSVEISNTNANAFSINLTVKIISEDSIQVEKINGQSISTMTPGVMVAYHTSEVTYLPANGNITIPFTLEYGFKNNPGKYNVQYAVFNNAGKLIGSASAITELNGSGSALNVNRCFIVTGGVEYDPTIGPNVAPNGEVYGKCSITNTSSEAIIGLPTAEYAVNSVVGSTSNNAVFNQNISVTIPGGSTQEVMFPLPSLTTPQVYEALAHLVDDQGNSITNKIAFRWVVAGESANIRSITHDSNEYVKGSIAKVTIGADPSLDLYWRGGGPAKNSGEPINASSGATYVQPELQGTPLGASTIIATVKDGNGVECGTAEHKVTTDPNVNIWPDQTIDVPISKDCKDIIVEAKVSNEGRELAFKQVTTNPKEEGALGVKNNIWILVTMILGIIAVVVGAVWLFIKKRKGTPPVVTALLLFFVVSSWLISGKVDLSGVTIVGEAHAALSASVKYHSVAAYRRGQPCPGPVWTANNPQPQGDDGQGGCMLGIVSGHDKTTFTALDTSNEISMGADKLISAHIAGQFTGYGCSNSVIGLYVRAYVNNSQEGVSIDGQGPVVRYDNLGSNGGGGGTPFDRNIKIASTINKCGPLDVRIEMIPYIKHVGVIASVKSFDQPLTEADVPGWKEITYLERENCGGNGDCWATIQKAIDGGPCVQCAATCATENDCKYAANGCTACLPAANGGAGRTCQTPIACGHSCASNLDCAEAINGCTSCLPNLNGQGSSCQTQPKCGDPCINPASCEGAQNGCTACIDDGTGAKCGTCPAGMNYDPTQKKCVCPNPGETNPHKVCDGDKCLSVGSCGVTTCGDDKACFAEEMCKCDGFEAVQLQYPSNEPFIFDSFAKVEGTDLTKAVVQGISFTMYESDKSNPNVANPIATSQMFTPEIVSSTASKARYKARWTMTPPQIKAGKTYRVLAQIKCVPKKKSAVAVLPANQYQSTVLGISTANAQEDVNPTPSPSPDYLQLTSLNFIKQVNTDKCYSAGFEMQEGIGTGQ